jgi:hypothetical protein
MALMGTGFFGCGGDEPVCERYGTCGRPLPDGGSQGADGGPIGPCDPHGQTPIGEKCGVYLSFTQGHDSNAGVFTYAPKKSFASAAALALEKNQPVFACAEDFAETVVLPPGVTIYGGLDCNDEWRYKAGKTVIAPLESGAPALDLPPGPAKTHLEDILVRARDADKPGQSSIAMRAIEATAELVRCELVAGKGGDGLDGESHLSDPMLEGTKGKPGESACTFQPPEPIYGGTTAYKACTVDLVSKGGKGGDGGYGGIILPGVPFPAGGSGDNGMPAGAGGKGGLGQPISGAWSCAMGGKGQDGADGANGQSGQGAPALGPLDVNGYVPVDGTPGTPGALAQGGGGGGASKGGLVCSGNSNLSYGAAGGSGGSGGCGGKGGGAGTGGGASIALISATSLLTFTESKLVAGEGGRGGAGGDGQAGGVGGPGGKGGLQGFYGLPGCDGGHGGKGGKGAPGGGGAGGPSYVIAVSGSMPVIGEDSVVLPGIAGKGGPGGEANAAANAGVDGTAGDIFSF